MLTYEEIMNYCSNYKIENGTVIDKLNNQKVTDENTLLRVKTSILLFKEAKESYQSDVQQFGRTSKTQQDYITKTMEKFGVNNEENNYGVNKLINALITSNGHYEENMSGNDLQNSKFAILVEPKKEYTMAYLRLKFREKGLDIDDLKINQDLTELQHNGISKVIIDFKVKKLEQTKIIDNNFLHHPKATELNELEKQLQIAKQNNDEVAYNYAKTNIEKIIRENRLEVSPDKWELMNVDEQISYVTLKMNEAKVLNDQDEFNYWNANLKSLKLKKANMEEIKESQSSFSDYTVINEQQPSTEIQHNSTEEVLEKDYLYYYTEMLRAVKKYTPQQSFTEKAKKQIIGEIFYNEIYLIDKISEEQEFKDIMEFVVNDLNSNEMETRLANIVLTEMQEKYRQLKLPVELKQDKYSQIKPVNKEDELDLSVLINSLRKELTNIQHAYQSMLADGYIDDAELATLIGMIEKVLDNGYSLNSIATDQKDIRMISVIIDTLEEEQKKLKKMQNGIEEIGMTMK